MRITTAAVVALVVCASAWAAPPPWAAKTQLPASASESATPPSKLAEVIPPVPPPPIIPEILASFTSGSSSSSVAAQAAVADATSSIAVRLQSSAIVSVIQMTGTIRSLRATMLRPVGRAGDLEIGRWSFADRLGRRIGDGNMLCRWATVARRLCWGEIRLPKGRLVMLGSSQTRGLGEFAVIGGTGVYTFKQGLLLFRQLSIRKYNIRVLLA